MPGKCQLIHLLLQLGLSSFLCLVIDYVDECHSIPYKLLPLRTLHAIRKPPADDRLFYHRTFWRAIRIQTFATRHLNAELLIYFHVDKKIRRRKEIIVHPLPTPRIGTRTAPA